MLLAGQRLLEEHSHELAVGGRQTHGDLALDEPLVPAAVLDQVGDGDEPEAVLRAELDQIGDARHRAVVLHDLADHAGGVQPGQTCEINGRLGLARALEDATAARAQREHVPRLDEIVPPPRGIDRDLDRARAVVRRDAGADPFARLDRDGEGRPVRRLVALGHLA